MYIDVADLTMEQVNKVTQMLSSARMSAYLEPFNGHAYLYAVPSEKSSVWEEVALAQI